MTHHSTLAIDGGSPVRTAPWPAWPEYTAREVAIIERVVASGRVNYWTGEEGRAFEREYAEYVGAPFAIAVANGTVALELALRALGVGPGDEVVVPCRTFIASAASVAAVGATPVLCDVDVATQTLTAETAEAVLTDRTRAVIPVHLAGMPVDMDPLLDLCARRGLLVIEDCAQAHGARYRGRPVGSIGNAGAFSFCQDKIITTLGEGGMLVMDERNAYEAAVRYKDHGRAPVAPGVSDPPGSRCFRYIHESFGTNYRLTEVQSAVGRHQLAHLDESVEARRRNADVLTHAARAIPGIRVPDVPSWAFHAYYKCYVHVDLSMLAPGWTRDRIADAVFAEGIAVGTGACPDLGSGAPFAEIAGAERARPAARALGEETLMFEVHPTLSRSDVASAATALDKVMGEATGRKAGP